MSFPNAERPIDRRSVRGVSLIEALLVLVVTAIVVTGIASEQLSALRAQKRIDSVMKELGSPVGACTRETGAYLCRSGSAPRVFVSEIP